MYQINAIPVPLIPFEDIKNIQVVPNSFIPLEDPSKRITHVINGPFYIYDEATNTKIHISNIELTNLDSSGIITNQNVQMLLNSIQQPVIQQPVIQQPVIQQPVIQQPVIQQQPLTLSLTNQQQQNYNQYIVNEYQYQIALLMEERKNFIQSINYQNYCNMYLNQEYLKLLENQQQEIHTTPSPAFDPIDPVEEPPPITEQQEESNLSPLSPPFVPSIQKQKEKKETPLSPEQVYELIRMEVFHRFDTVAIEELKKANLWSERVTVERVTRIVTHYLSIEKCLDLLKEEDKLNKIVLDACEAIVKKEKKNKK
jgi:hypothetical protein